MEKTFQPKDIERSWYQTWEQQGYFKPQGNGSPFAIMIPPPNVTGSLHMGHGFECSIIDSLIRYQRMLGHHTLWQVGTDHAGIATQMVVERQLNAEGASRKQLGREEFIKKVWQWKGESGGTITRQLRRMGASVDWSRERFTMDEGLSKAVLEAFIRLYDEGLIYRGNRLVNWDPKLHTAISDLEVINEEENGYLWHFRYPLADGVSTADGKKYVTIATTRPETMLGDSAIAVHPDDERYQGLVGKMVELPLTGRQIPIISDTYVDPAFGTGCVKITPAHDFNDYEVGKRHQLEMINIFTIDATINDDAPKDYCGFDRFKARERIVEDLTKLGLVEKIDDHKLKVPRGDRSGVVIEPYLTNQWYVKTKTLADPAIQAVENGDIEFIPKQWENTYFSWMRDIQDWCISRQLWWGHRIPAWYDDDGNIYVAHNEKAVRKKYGLAADLPLQQDEDVLDTWFSSGLWTFSTLGWPDNTEELKTFHPSNVLVTGFDIIFFWVARMIMMTLKFCNEVPFKRVYIHGLIKDQDGQKMSKSKGNVLDPIDLIDGIDLETLVEKRVSGLMQPQMAKQIENKTRTHFKNGITSYGTDALRFTFCSLASTGRDIKFDMGRIEGYRNFCNKLWNAARFVLSNTEDQDCGLHTDDISYSLADRWILSRLQKASQAVCEAFNTYRFDLASQAMYDFIWHEYCDWYVELCKPVLYGDDIAPATLRGTRHTLVRILENILRLAHPIMPFITEEIWQRVAPLAGKTGPTIMQQTYPLCDESLIDEKAETDIEWVKGVIIGIRNIRGEMNISPKKQIPVCFNNGSQTDQQRLEQNYHFLMALGKTDSITWLKPNDSIPPSATQLVGDMEVLVPISGLIDKDAEITRLEKEIGKLEKDASRISAKLGNEKFVNNAPPAVVEKEKHKLTETQSALEQLQINLNKIKQL